MEDRWKAPRELVRLSEGYYNLIDDEGNVICHFKIGDKVVFNDGECGLKPSFIVNRIAIEKNRIVLEHIKKNSGICRSMNIANIRTMQVIPTTLKEKIAKLIIDNDISIDNLCRSIASKTVFSGEEVKMAIQNPSSLDANDRIFLQKNILMEIAEIGVKV